MEEILLIEDNAEIRENVIEILEMAHYRILSAECAKTGLDMATAHKPALIICAVKMPVLDGFGVLQLIRKDPVLRNIPFLFISSEAGAAAMERTMMRQAMTMGADDYMAMPFEGTDLLNAVEGRLRKSAQVKKELQGSGTGYHDLAHVSLKDFFLEHSKVLRVTGKYKRKQLLYTEGTYPSRLYYLQKGKVKTFQKNKDGKELTTGLYNEGDFVGYTALLCNTTYRDSAEALEDSEIAVISRAEFEEMLGGNPPLMKHMIAVLANEVYEKEAKLLAVAYNSLRKKVADALVRLHKKYNTGQEKNYVIDISRENLASLAGVAKESLTRTLGDFRKENLISIAGIRIVILNLARLESMYN